MRSVLPLVAFLTAHVAAQKGLTAQGFSVGSSANANNVKLAWDVTGSTATSYSIQRRTGSSAFSAIGSTPGNTFDDYGLTIGTNYTYQIVSSSTKSNEASIQPFTIPQGYSTYSNTQASTATRRSRIYANKVYYQYSYVDQGSGHFHIQQETSNDGYTFSSPAVVLTSDIVCATIQSKTCKLERTSFNLNPTTGNVVMWAHFENAQDYSLGQVASAHAKPGSNFTFDGHSQPLGHDSRDLGFFADTDNAAYLISATDTNTNLNIYKLTSNWTAVASLVNTVAKKAYREAPAMIKVGKSYYLFTSRASGWYPSTPNVVTATSLSGTFSDAKIPCDIATFASQSGVVQDFGNAWGMLGDRWGANWAPVDGENREYLLPISFASDNSGYAFYHWYPKVLNQDPQSSASAASLIGVQSGRILSQGKTVTSTPSGGSKIDLSVDGQQNDPDKYFAPKSVPFTWQVDLGANHNIAQVDWATRMVQGSETYYQYNITGSTDNKSWTLLADQSKNTAVGFVPSFVSASGQFRYIRVNVAKVINTHNGNEADNFAGVIEGTVFGS